MNDNEVLEAGKQSQTEEPKLNPFESALALLQKGDIFSLKLKTGEVTVERGLKSVDVSVSDLGFEASYFGQERQNKFVTHCTNIAKKMVNLEAKQVSDDGHDVTVELKTKESK